MSLVLPRRALLTGAAALAAYAALPKGYSFASRAVFAIKRRRRFPFRDANLDLDFVNGRYYWGGREHSSADFTTFTLNGSSFGPYGLTPSSTIDVTIALSGVGTFPPGMMALACYPTSTPGTNRQPLAIDDGTAANRIVFYQSTAAGINLQNLNASVSQADISGLTYSANHPTSLLGNVATNEMFVDTDGKTVGNDVTCTMPTVTTIRIGKGTGANTEFLGAIMRVLLWTRSTPFTERQRVGHELSLSLLRQYA